MKYYACFWIVPYIHNTSILCKLIDRLAALDSEIVEFRQEPPKWAGFLSWHIGLRVPSEEAFNQAANIAKEMLNLENWYPISQGLFLSGMHMDFRKMQGTDSLQFQKILVADGFYNLARQEWYENAPNENVYYTCNWVIKEEVPLSLIDAVARASELNCSLFFLGFQQIEQFHTLCFGTRLRKKISLKTFLRHTGTKSILVNFTRIEEKEFYYGSRLSVMGVHWFNHVVPDFFFKRLVQENREKRRK